MFEASSLRKKTRRGFSHKLHQYHEHHEYHDYSEDDAATKMHHLMHSDTIIVVFSLVVMIMVGLVFRSLCMKLTSINQRKERVRGGLKQIAESMNYVTRYVIYLYYLADIFVMLRISYYGVLIFSLK